jgi:hypothetical protein
VIAWTSDVRNRWSSRWIEWPQFSQFWAQVVKRTTRPPEDPNRQVSVKIDGNRATLSLDAQTGTEAADRHYLNFLPTTATITDPRGEQHDITLPQTAPGRYETIYPVEDDGIYSLQVNQTDTDGTIASSSGGFVVPYSPEYRAAGTNEEFLDNLADQTGGRLIHDPEQAFVHDLPAVGAPRPLWPYLLALAALIFVADVGARRIRITGPELRAGYYAVRRRLGYIDEAIPPVTRPIQHHPTPGMNLIMPSGVLRVRSRDPGTQTQVTRQGRLLAAKQRASRR